MDPDSMEAAETQNINALYKAIALDPYIFDKADEIPFVNTPLHVAASTGQTRLAIEIGNLKPSLGMKLNRDGLSPLHLAVLNGHSETVKGLIKLDKDLIRVKGREMLTPLHYTIEIDDRVDILAEFLLACPESIEDLNARGETPLHIAVKKCNVRALEVLMGWIRKTSKHQLIYMPDARGNTILHTAVSTSRPHPPLYVHVLIVKSIARGSSKYYRLHVNDKNLEGATAADIAARLALSPARTEIESILRRGGASRCLSPANDYSLVDYLISRETLAEHILRISYFWREAFPMEIRNTVIVVAALITTATFQSVLTPPGGSGGGGNLGDNNYLSGTPPGGSGGGGDSNYLSGYISQIFNTSTTFYTFYAFNTLAFIGSVILILFVLPSKVFTPLYFSLAFLISSYLFALSLWSVLIVASIVAPLGTAWCVTFFLKRERLRMLLRVLKNRIS